jgi:Ni,Fe-hydrogenase III large subunit
MSNSPLLSIHNGVAFDAARCPLLSIDEFRPTIFAQVAAGARLAALFGRPSPDAAPGEALRLCAVLARPEQGDLAVTATDVREQYPALTPVCPQAHWFEREIAEQWGVRPLDHPWLKPIRFQPPRSPRADLGSGPAGRRVCGVTDYFSMSGAEVHEVAVGPVHAGIIEPGHFRFQCHGETVYHLEISLGYQHRGVERAVLAGPAKRIIPYMETLAGDTTIGHVMAYCRAIEGLGKTRVSARAQVIRGVALELERIANHVGDLGALAGDVGYLPTLSYCGRIRGDVLNITAAVCGNRFGRGLIRPGGATRDLDPPLVEQLLSRLDGVARDAKNAIELLWNSPSVMARFDQIGVVPRKVCQELGLVGVAARACGWPQDVRRDFPFGIFRFAHIPVASWDSSDVFARAYVRWLEIQRSLAFVAEQLQSLPEGPLCAPPEPPRPEQMVVALVEGWRGEICHVVQTGGDGAVRSYKIVDPSFHNWFGLAYALRNGQIADFPLCNKSFNLSYCGHDL